MSATTSTPLPAEGPSTLVEDVIAALMLQLADIDEYEATKKGKYKADDIPDLEVAYASYLDEIKAQLQILDDIKLAHSIANAVSVDAEAIEEVVRAESQAQRDRQVALLMDAGDTDVEPPPPYTESAQETSIEAEIERLGLYSDGEDSDSTIAGPSEPYVRRQVTAMQKLGRQGTQCIACADSFRAVDVTKLECKHVYCKDCLHTFIMRGIVERDLNLLPPRCCGETVPFEVIKSVLEEDELVAFQDGQLERDTRDKTYCSNAECGRFVSPVDITAGKAVCRHCGTQSCALCKQTFHEDDCPADIDLQDTLQLGRELNWRRCFSCRALVSIDFGCNHMM
ncbi:Hypothetical predicted protein [Lecanosticta acicola]|uniref:RBR-type E3 ubiquitin transferase n=1 Tax=Lecanosticta acicola TaxID=111012 RepID=A0AAI9EBZ7_9PEZI|nr:Hypothetical predicted protein [Lecanosticta acicola]